MSESKPERTVTVDLAQEQRRIRLNAVLSIAFCSSVLVGACQVLPRFFTLPETLAERLAFAIKADVFVLLWLLIAVRMVSSGRYRSAADNRGSAFSSPSPELAVKVAFLQNTLEQSVLTVGAHLALASLLTGPALFFIPAAVVLFGVGRLLFWRGYPGGAGARSFGMATTAIPTAVGYAWAMVLVLQDVLT